jgi:methanethiol oxidase
MFENGLIPEALLGARYGRRLHFWDLNKRKHLQTIDFGDRYQLLFELRPAHDPTKAYGFVNCVVSLENLSSSIWTWYRNGNKWAVKKVIQIPAEAASEDKLPPMLKGFKSVPPFVTDIDLSMDDKFLYAACWGTGDLRQYDVSDPFKPKLTGKVRIGGVVAKATHARAKNGALSGGPQMVEISRDGKRVYFTNSLYGAIDSQLYPDGIEGWMVKLDVNPNGGVDFDEKLFVHWPTSHRPHQLRLERGDCSNHGCGQHWQGWVPFMALIRQWDGCSLLRWDCTARACSSCTYRCCQLQPATHCRSRLSPEGLLLPAMLPGKTC